MELLSSIGNEIRNYRNEAGLSQEQLSALCGVERAQLSKIEKGLLAGVTFKTIATIYDSLGMKLVPVKEEEKNIDVHPFVKWAGGKTQLLETIKSHLPETYNRYFEPFVGGGALLFKLQPKAFSINDSNKDLMYVYQCLEDNELFKLLKEELVKHEKNHSEEYYYQIREMDKHENFDSLPIYVRAGRLIYLNKACFNGLYRVNSKGYFNVPSGKKKEVNCFDRKTFDNLNLFFKNRKPVITNVDFAKAVKNAKAGDFVYFDPPYDALDERNSFTSYDKISFGKEEQIRLSEVFKELSKKGVYVMLSNHNTKFINELYKDFHITVVNAKRMINSKADGRGDVEEVLITNYE
ncbi:MAG: Dam family site-specific DNA-(adenine-N6)-methyltransferase [Candidatus Caccosoma sp.]|nr:Dam family site-specific DNA-(adenine-N6)-methyltransferase [Candidatus Caccosoma sp.]